MWVPVIRVDEQGDYELDLLTIQWKRHISRVKGISTRIKKVSVTVVLSIRWKDTIMCSRKDLCIVSSLFMTVIIIISIYGTNHMVKGQRQQSPTWLISLIEMLSRHTRAVHGQCLLTLFWSFAYNFEAQSQVGSFIGELLARLCVVIYSWIIGYSKELVSADWM